MLFRQTASPKVGNVLACALTAGFAVGLFFFSACQASAARIDIIDGEGFESPYVAGALEGQAAKLTNDAPFPGTQAWLASTGTTSTAVVQSTVTHGGSPQAVQVDRAANEASGGGRFGVPVTAWPDAARFVCIEWDMRVEDAAGGSGAFGPFFGVEAYDDAFGATGLMGSMGVDATTGDVLYQETSTGHLTNTGSTVVLGEWNHFHIDLDFARQEYTVILNGSTLLTEGFVDGPGLANFSDAPIAAVAAAGDSISQALTGTAYFDNYEVYQLTTKIPEPTALVLSLFALVSLGRRTRATV